MPEQQLLCFQRQDKKYEHKRIRSGEHFKMGFQIFQWGRNNMQKPNYAEASLTPRLMWIWCSSALWDQWDQDQASHPGRLPWCCGSVLKAVHRETLQWWAKFEFEQNHLWIETFKYPLSFKSVTLEEQKLIQITTLGITAPHIWTAALPSLPHSHWGIPTSYSSIIPPRLSLFLKSPPHYPS